MKSILTDFSRLNTAILTILAALNFDFLGISHFRISENSQKCKIRAGKMVKMAVFNLSKSAKIDFT